MSEMMQGDSYNIAISLKNNAGQEITPDDVTDVEITIGRTPKTYLQGEVSYADGKWLYPMSQDESFQLWPMMTDAQVRVKWPGGVVEGQKLTGMPVAESKSKEVL